jgi:hypothetical protein
VASSNTHYLTVLAGGQTELNWNGRDAWGSAEDVSRDHARLLFQAGVNILRPGGPSPALLSEADKTDNLAQITVDFLPYQPQVSDACPPADNLRLEMNASSVHPLGSLQPVLQAVVHNEGHTEVVRVPLRTTDADGRRHVTYAHWIPPCGGTVVADVGPLPYHLTYPVTITLNPADATDAVAESDRSDNEVVMVETDARCVGATDLWLTADDVTIDGDDVLVTVHLSGEPPSGPFGVLLYHTQDGRFLAGVPVRLTTCDESITLRLADVLAGLDSGYLLVQIDTESQHLEAFYPQHNNSAIVPLSPSH